MDPEDLIAGAVEYPWGRELVGAIGTLLIRSARIEADADLDQRLPTRGGSDPALAIDLLRRARETAPEDATEEWTDDEMRGHILIERFTEAHDLDWNKVRENESPDESHRREAAQLRQIMWAGLRALATLASPLRNVTNAWQLLDELGDDEIVSVLAEQESDRVEATADQEAEEIEASAAAHALAWLAIRKPDLLANEHVNELIEILGYVVSPFHHVMYSALMMAGTGPVRRAIDNVELPTTLRPALAAFVRAQAVTDPESGERDDDEAADAYDDMHGALEMALADTSDLSQHVRASLAVLSVAAQLTSTDANAHAGNDDYINSPTNFAKELLKRPTEIACLILDDAHDGDCTVRQHTLAEVAAVAPDAAGKLAADFPDLVGDDPRIEPAARERAQRWVQAARYIASSATDPDAHRHLPPGSDARRMLDFATKDRPVPEDWSIQQIAAAAAYAAAALLHAASSLDQRHHVFVGVAGA